MPLPPYLTALRNLVATDITGTGVPATTVVGPDAYGQAPAVGGSTNFAREDHDHGLPAASSGTPAASVTGPDAYGASAVVGTSLNYARQDHNHGLPAATGGTPATTVTGPDAFGASAVVGTSLLYARADHDHGLPVPANGSSPATTVTGPPAYGAGASVGTGLFYARNDHIHGMPAAFDNTSNATRLTTLEAAVAALQTPPGGGGLGTIGTFPGSYGNTMSGFISALSDMSIDTLQVTGGTYSNWHDLALNMDRTSRPLLVQPVGGNVIWNNNGGSGDGVFYPGWGGTPCRWVKFDSAGTGYNFQINNFPMTQTGLISTDWAENCQFNGFHCVGNYPVSGDGLTSWCVYISSDGTSQGKNLTFNNWYTDNTTGVHGEINVGTQINGLQFYHTPGPVTVTAHNWTTLGGYWGMVARTGTGLDFAGWNISGAMYPFDCGGGSGTVKNMTSTGSTHAQIINGGMVDGGGNSWS